MTRVTGDRKERTTVIGEAEFQDMLDKTREAEEKLPEEHFFTI